MNSSFTMEDEKEWCDFFNALQFFESVEELHLVNRTYIKTNAVNGQKESTSRSLLYSDTNNRTKPSMYSYDVINYYQNADILKEKILQLTDEIIKSINHIYDIFRLCNENVFLCFNGGKDAVVTLHLFRCAYAKYLNDKKGKISKPKLIYFKGGNAEFPEVSQFLNETVFTFDFDLFVVEGSWKEGVINFIEDFKTKYKKKINEKKNLQELNTEDPYIPIVSFVMGTRFNDPYCENLEILNISSKKLPPYLYLNPIFYWSYGAVWTFILYFKLNYCILYNHGYTSIGSTADTIRNEYLKWNNCYLPAYFLENWEHERFNRIVQKRV